MTTAYHYSSKNISIGDEIYSNQDKGVTYDLIWQIYKEVNPRLPRKFGYAYPAEIAMKTNCYEVESDFCIKGNLNYSIYLVMDKMSQQEFTVNKKIDLKERLNMRTKWLKEQAQKYFNELQDEKSIELISDCWVVTKKL